MSVIRRFAHAVFGFTLIFLSGSIFAALEVPTDVQMPGTQPGELKKAPDSGRCKNCHGGYDADVEPYHGFQGSMMAHAGRDPIFWATVAIAEQDFDGAGDLCIRCHSPSAWLDDRSTPTDGSSLTDGDAAAGVECDFCHRLTDPDGTEHPGVQNGVFVAQTGGEGHYGGGQYVLSDEGNTKFGPYDDAEARHGSVKSLFHRSPDLCGTCHDVSNPVVGNLAHNSGALPGSPAVAADQTLGGVVDGKAAFNNLPYSYGVVERTYSEHQASWFGDPLNLVSAYVALPEELQAGAIAQAWAAATESGATSGNYTDGDARSFTCQTCHMRPLLGQGSNKNSPFRFDLARHDLTGGNYWMPSVMQYMDDAGTLLLGGGIAADERAMLDAGALRARENLNNAASLELDGNTLRVVNLTGHKLISGYPEGRRMWLNVKWYDNAGAKIREDGEYGDLPVQIDEVTVNVRTILNPDDVNTRIYEVHGAITKEWASQLVGLNGAYTGVPVAFDPVSGTTVATLGDVASGSDDYHESFHFVLNNKVVFDNRIPPYGLDYDEALVRNVLPVPAGQYGSPGSGGVFNYWDEVTLAPPAGAVYATISLMYQPTSWEYIQFLYLANDGTIGLLANEGQNLLDAWLNTGMAEPHVMATLDWGTPPAGENTPPVAEDDSYPAEQDVELVVGAPGVLDNDTDADGDSLTAVLVSPPGNAAFFSLSTDGGFTYTPYAAFTGQDTFTYLANDGQDDSAAATVTIDVNAAPADCSVYTDSQTCRSDAACRWQNKQKLCVNR